jgi:hypothetical protein
MARFKTTGKIGNYSGNGPNLADVIVGRHDLGLEFFPMGMAHSAKYDLYTGNTSYTPTDFTATTTGSGSISMSASGLLIATGATTSRAQDQLLFASTPVIGANGFRFGAYFEATFSDVTNTGFVLGFSATDTDWFFAEGAHSLAFLSAKGGTTVVGRTKDGTTGSSTATLASLTNGVRYKFSCFYDAINSACFFAVKPASGVFVASDFVKKTTNLPASAVRLTRVLDNNNTAINTMTVHKTVYFNEVR